MSDFRTDAFQRARSLLTEMVIAPTPPQSTSTRW